MTRSIRLLELLAQSRRPMNLTELAIALGLAKSSTANICLALEAARMVERVPQGYRLGLRIAELGGAFATQFNQVREFYAVCDSSAVLRDELVQVALLDGCDALYIARHEGAQSLRIGTPLGSRLPAALSATGRALLSVLDDASLIALLGESATFPALTDKSLRTLDELRKRLTCSREQGWALDVEESFPGIVGVAVPLEGWAPGDPHLALGVGIPAAEASRERVALVAGALQEAAHLLTNPFSAAAVRGSRTEA